MFNPRDYFDLGQCAHSALFEEGQPVWEALKRIRSYLEKRELGKIEGSIEKGALLVNPETISIGKGSIVEAGAYIRGPCIIGENCQVRHGAYIRGAVITGNQCIIGHATEVKNALFLEGAQAGHFAYVGDTILGNHVNLGAGTICANLRLDNKNVSIRMPASTIESGLRKFGAILGDGVQIGCNCVTNPGVVMGKGSRSYPCLSISGVIPDHHVIKWEERAVSVPL